MKYKYYTKYVMYLSLFVFLFSSCKKDEKHQSNTNEGLTFTIRGVKDPLDSGIKLTANKNGSQNNITDPEKLLKTKKIEYQGLEAEIDLYESSYSDDIQVNKFSSQKLGSTNTNVNKRAAVSTTSPLATGTKYRVLVYKEDGTYVGAVEGVSGSPSGKVNIDYDTKYIWYAYSFGTSADLPELDNTSDPSIEATPDLGLLYATGEITTASAPTKNNNIDIVLERRLSWVEVTIDTRGTFAPMIPAGTTITTENLTSSTFKIKDNEYQNPTPATGTLTGTSFQLQNSAVTKDSIYVGNFYLGSDGRNQKFALKLNSIQLALDYKVNGQVATRTFNNIPYAFDFIPEPGKKYTVRIRLVESGVPIAGATWARGNLYYTWKDNGFRFRHSGTHPYEDMLYPNTLKYDVDKQLDPEYFYNDIEGTYDNYVNLPVEFWNFKTVVPYASTKFDLVRNSGYPASDTYEYNAAYVGKGYYYENDRLNRYINMPEGDPCSQVYPAGKWRLPTKAEGEALVRALIANSGKYVYADTVNQYFAGVFPYADYSNGLDPYYNVIEFPFHGSTNNSNGWTSRGLGPGFKSDNLGETADPRFAYEPTNPYYSYVKEPANNNFARNKNSSSKISSRLLASGPELEFDGEFTDRESAFMLMWTSEEASNWGNSNGTYKYGWAYGMKIKAGEFASLVGNAYTPTNTGFPYNTLSDLLPSPIIREVGQMDGLKIRCVRK